MKQIQDIEPYVHNLCRQPSNLFGPSFYDLHIKQVEKYSLQLSERLNADKVVVQIAALMHDVAAISDFSLLAQHAEKGAEMAEKLLENFLLTLEQKKKVLHCIRTHSQPIALEADIPEAVCISNADAMSQIAQPFYWTYYIFGVRKFAFEEGYNWYVQRVNSHWNTLIGPAKEMIKKEYRKTCEMFHI
jgi:uncharacterized protein